jgi:hypothetical protein
MDDGRLEAEVLMLMCKRLITVKKSALPMPYKSILQEVHQLNDVSERLELLSAQHPQIEEALMTICGNIRNTATLLEVLVAINVAEAEGASTSPFIATNDADPQALYSRERSTPSVRRS